MTKYLFEELYVVFIHLAIGSQGCVLYHTLRTSQFAGRIFTYNLFRLGSTNILKMTLWMIEHEFKGSCHGTHNIHKPSLR